jgi:hypothetical protein
MAASQGMPESKNWQSFRTIVETVLCAGILWLVRSVSAQSENMVALQVKVDQLQADNARFSLALANVPALDTRTTRVEVVMDDIKRRLERLEGQRATGMKEWQR